MYVYIAADSEYRCRYSSFITGTKQINLDIVYELCIRRQSDSY